jgi:hypothetical protein
MLKDDILETELLRTPDSSLDEEESEEETVPLEMPKR